jgi:hypothetical protein
MGPGSKLANDRLSPVILAALKEFIVRKEAEGTGYERIEVAFEDSADYHIPKRKAFYGKWIFSPTKPLRLSDDRSADVYCVARTAKGNVVVYMWSESIPDESVYGRKLHVYTSFEKAAQNMNVNYAIRGAIRKQGIPVEELDI